MKEMMPVVVMFAVAAILHVLAWRKGRVTGKEAGWACGVLGFCALALVWLAW